MDKKMRKEEKEKKNKKSRGRKGGKVQHKQNNDEEYLEEIDMEMLDNDEEI